MSESSFPDHSDSIHEDKISSLARLARLDLSLTSYMDVRSAARLLASLLRSYRFSLLQGQWKEDAVLAEVSEKQRFGLVLAAIFDLISNIEYCSRKKRRVVNGRWIYCNRPDYAHDECEYRRVYYSFLKQCPYCCLDRGLERRLENAQHKPGSHHIGEITTTITAMLLRLIVAACSPSMRIATIADQSHDVDIIGYCEDLLVLLEVKASPMVTFPLVIERDAITDEIEGETREKEQHSLVDQELHWEKMGLFIPHRNWIIPFNLGRDEAWPYESAISFFSQAANFVQFLSAWMELFKSYSIPKRARRGKDIALAYLVNGWGDEIDSNKTKPGLGRTDDIKKGTYQMLKFGAYYKDEMSKLAVRSALVANLDPLFLYADYMANMIDIKWARSEAFESQGSHYLIESRSLHWLYEGIIAFNRPIIEDARLKEVFDLVSTDTALLNGSLDNEIDEYEQY